MSQIAREFLFRCFAPEETIALLLRSENPASTTQRIVRMGQVLEPRYLAWLAHENKSGANVYVAVNPLLPGSRKRTKESIASVRHLYLDIDADGDARLAVLRTSKMVPPPASILSTSPGKYQVLWRVEGFDFAHQEQTLKLLARAFGGDSACTDCNRVLRIPGFLNCKYDPPYRVTVECPDDSVWTPANFHFEIAAAETNAFIPVNGSGKQSCKHTNSESDWAWISDQLAQGGDAMKLTQELASRRSDKPNPLYTPNALWMLLPLAFGCSKASASTTSSPCSNAGAVLTFPLHFALPVRTKLPPRHNA
jgi:hypothetical protein